MKFIITRLLVFVGLLQITVQAQTVELRALALSRHDDLNQVFVRGPNDYHALAFSHYQPSKAVEVSAVNPLPIFERVPMADEALAPVVAHIPLPADAEGILLLAWDTSHGVKYVALADNIATASPRDWFLINTTDKRVAFRLGKDSEPVMVPSGETLRLKINVDLNRGAAALAVAESETNGWKAFYSTYLPVFEDSRTLLLFVQEGKKMRVKEITERVINDH